MTVIDVPVTNLKFADREFNANPYPELTKIAQLGPVVYHESENKYLVTRYRDCAKMLGDARHFHVNAEEMRSFFGGDTIASLDGERHKIFRSVWTKQLSGVAVKSDAENIRSIVAHQADALEEKLDAAGDEGVDAVRHFTRHIPSYVIADLLNIPRADSPQFIEWSDHLALLMEAVFDNSPTGEANVKLGQAAVDNLNGYVARLIDSGDFETAAGLIGDMLRSDARPHMSREDLIASVTLLVFGGNETTSKLMSTALWVFAQHPEQWEMLRTDRSLLSAAVEEVNRWMTVAPVSHRHSVGSDAEVAGIPLPEGSFVAAILPMANRDPERWENPDVFDITREKKPNMGFSHGIHGCLGMNLARLEVETMLDVMLDRFPAYEVLETDWGGGWGSAHGPVELLMRRGR